MKRHCCNTERGCEESSCDSEGSDCSCGCSRCGNGSEGICDSCHRESDELSHVPEHFGNRDPLIGSRPDYPMVCRSCMER